jgi:hypothetical protein
VLLGLDKRFCWCFLGWFGEKNSEVKVLARFFPELSCHSGGVGQLDKAVFVSDDVLQVPPFLGQGIAKQPESFTQQDGRYRQLDFVHQAELEKTLAQHGPTHEPDEARVARELMS